MKTIRLFVFMMISILAGGIISAQSSKSESFKVYGNCDMCKNRIETAVKSAGATSASWDSKTKILAVTYDPSKTNRAAIKRKWRSPDMIQRR
jgi:copper chaperone CopZ